MVVLSGVSRMTHVSLGIDGEEQETDLFVPKSLQTNFGQTLKGQVLALSLSSASAFPRYSEPNKNQKKKKKKRTKLRR